MPPAPEPASQLAEPSLPEGATGRPWQKRLLRICFALFTLEIGLFLVIFPWTDRWEFNYFQDVLPSLRDLWDEPAFRGALTGLGLVNVYIACLQFLHSFRRD